MVRQKLLLLYIGDGYLEAPVIGWTCYDGTVTEDPPRGPVDQEPPYATVLAAMRDGWRVIQLPELRPPVKGQEYETSFLRFEVVLEKLETIDG